MKKRLKSLATMVKQADRVIDVGADHALLDIYLAKKYKNTSFLAIDISKNAVENAKKNVLKSSLEKRIEVLENDGLKNIKLNKDDFIVLSGLGTSSITKIIKERVDEVNHVLIQSNRDIELLRKKMNEFGFKICNEKVVYDEIYYIFIYFEKGNIKYDETDFWLGPIIKKSRNFNYFQFLINKYKKILPGIPDNDFKKYELINHIKYLENLIEKK